jgi:hypothetical protein
LAFELLFKKRRMETEKEWGKKIEGHTQVRTNMDVGYAVVHVYLRYLALGARGGENECGRRYARGCGCVAVNLGLTKFKTW